MPPDADKKLLVRGSDEDAGEDDARVVFKRWCWCCGLAAGSDGSDAGEVNACKEGLFSVVLSFDGLLFRSVDCGSFGERRPPRCGDSGMTDKEGTDDGDDGGLLPLLLIARVSRVAGFKDADRGRSYVFLRPPALLPLLPPLLLPGLAPFPSPADDTGRRRLDDDKFVCRAPAAAGSPSLLLPAPLEMDAGALDTQCFQPSKSMSACMHPHSIVFCHSHLRLTGLTRKSLHPAASASVRSESADDAVSATMMTGNLKTLVSSASSGAILVAGASAALSSSAPPASDDADDDDDMPSSSVSVSALLLLLPLLLPLFVVVNTPIRLACSSRRISLVASRPLSSGIWISMSTRWNPPWRHFSIASWPFLAQSERIERCPRYRSRMRMLMMLSSTMSTLTCGTTLLS